MRSFGRHAWIAVTAAVAPAMVVAQHPPAAPTPPTARVPASLPPPPAQDIVVTARDLPDAAMVRQLARAISPHPSGDEPMARFEDPVCLATEGLPRPVLIALANRFIDDAYRAGVRVGGTKCAPNVLVLFVDDGRTDMARIGKRLPHLFDDMSLHEMRHIIDEPGPVHAAISSEIRSRDGDRGGVGMLKVPIATRLVPPVRRDMLTSVVLIDRSAAVGRTPEQLADYAAMRSLAQVRPVGAKGGDTILTLFDNGASSSPSEMTMFDRGYLKALYAGQGNTPGARKVDQISRSIVKTMTAAIDKPAAAP
jgi:hypothetical protein